MRKLLIATHHRLDLWIAPEWFAERLRKDFPQLDVVRQAKPDGIDRELVDTEIAFTSALQPQHFRLARKLRWIHSPAAAVHQFLFPELAESDVILTNAQMGRAKGWQGTFRKHATRMRNGWNALGTTWKFTCVAGMIAIQIALLPVISDSRCTKVGPTRLIMLFSTWVAMISRLSGWRGMYAANFSFSTRGK